MNEDEQRLNREGRAVWDAKAEFWDNLHGEAGNTFHRRLVEPTVLRLLGDVKGERVLDVACGSGQMARRLAALGARVTAVDFSAALLERARARGQSSGVPIDYRPVDATDEEALAALGAAAYEAVTCTIAIMDMSVIAPLFRGVHRVLGESGRFVVATNHPAFSTNNPTFTIELVDREGQQVTQRNVRIDNYIEPWTGQGIGARGEPLPHTYYHRPLQQIVGEAFKAGFVLDGLEEPAYESGEGEPAGPLSLRHFSQIPPLLVIRLRPA